MGRILLMMSERAHGIFRSGRPVGIGRWAERGIAGRSDVEREESFIAPFQIIEKGELHYEIVGVLPIDNGEAVSGLALLKQQWVAAIGDGRRLEGQHSANRENARTPVVLRHAHEPVCGKKLVSAAGAGLL